MSRSVRRVPLDYQHPVEWVQRFQWLPGGGSEVRPIIDFRPLHEYTDLAEHLRYREEDPDDWETAPDPKDYMPDFSGTPEDQLGWCMYETTTEGTPISPVLRTPEELAEWLAENHASSFGGATATREQWLSMIRAGWAPSAIIQNGTMTSGVEFVADHQE